MDRVEFVPGQSLPLFELKPPLLDGVDFVVKRMFDLVGLAAPAHAVLARDGADGRARSSSTRAARSCSARGGRASAARRSRA